MGGNCRQVRLCGSGHIIQDKIQIILEHLENELMIIVKSLRDLPAGPDDNLGRSLGAADP